MARRRKSSKGCRDSKGRIRKGCKLTRRGLRRVKK